MAIGDVDFARYLSEAETFAVAYGYDRVPGTTVTVPAITILGRELDPLTKAFDALARLATASNGGDAVDLGIVFRDQNRYLLALSPEPTRLTRRCLGFERVLQALPTFPIWVKHQDQTNPWLRQFEKYCRNLVSPFLLDGAVYSGLAVGGRPEPSLMTSLPPQSKILKFSARFSDEAEARPGSWASSILATADRRQVSRPGPEGAKEVLRSYAHHTRARTFATHFPVTLGRLGMTPHLASIEIALQQEGIRRWQIEQAVCNLALSLENVGRMHYEGLSMRALEKAIVDWLRRRFEMADGTSAPAEMVTTESVREQIRLDAYALLRKVGRKSVPSSAQEAVEALQQLGLLDSVPE